MGQNIYGQISSPFGLISPKGTLNAINIEIRTIYGQRSDVFWFKSPKGTLNPIDIEIRTVYGQRSRPLASI